MICPDFSKVPPKYHKFLEGCAKMKDFKNLNHLAIEIARVEGLKKQMSIAQIKEVIKCIGMVLAAAEPDQSFDLVSALTKNGLCHLGKSKGKK